MQSRPAKSTYRQFKPFSLSSLCPFLRDGCRDHGLNMKKLPSLDSYQISERPRTARHSSLSKNYGSYACSPRRRRSRTRDYASGSLHTANWDRRDRGIAHSLLSSSSILQGLRSTVREDPNSSYAVRVHGVPSAPIQGTL